MTSTEKVVASVIQVLHWADRSHLAVKLLEPRHGVNKRTLGQKHDLKNKLQNYSCSKWPNRLTLKHK